MALIEAIKHVSDLQKECDFDIFDLHFYLEHMREM
jgi:hypothetical protein